MKLFAPSVTTRLFYLALIRIAVGLTFLSHFAGHVLGLGGEKSWIFESSLGDMLQRSLAEAQLPAFYRTFEQGIVQPNLTVFNYLVLLAELAIGISLTLGLFTRLGAAVALVVTANVILLKGFSSSTADIDHVFFICELVVLLANAGRVWGVDGLLFAPSTVVAPAPAARPARAS